MLAYTELKTGTISASGERLHAITNVASGSTSSFTTTYSGIHFVGGYFTFATANQVTIAQTQSGSSSFKTVAPEVVFWDSSVVGTTFSFPKTFAVGSTASASLPYFNVA
jgi:hypothetical protein